MKVCATQRLLSQKTTVEKITHYTKMLHRVKHRLLQLDHDRQPKTTQRYLAWAVRLEKRLAKLKSLHRH
jgi:ABC-type phosphate transport system auxiliary subunit